MKIPIAKLLTWEFFWSILPVLIWIPFSTVTYVFLYRISPEFCSKDFCFGRYIYLRELGFFMQWLALFYGIGYLYVLYIREAMFTIIWTFLLSISFGLLVIESWNKGNGDGSVGLFFGVFSFFFTIVGGIIATGFGNSNRSKKGRLVISFTLLAIFGLLVWFFLTAKAGFGMM